MVNTTANALTIKNNTYVPTFTHCRMKLICANARLGMLSIRLQMKNNKKQTLKINQSENEPFS
jgi:hypothetical protein